MKQKQLKWILFYATTKKEIIQTLKNQIKKLWALCAKRAQPWMK